MKAETREVRSHSTAKPKRQSRPIVNHLSDEDFEYLLEKLAKRWVRRGYSQLARDLAQEGAIKAWLKQGCYTGKNKASLRTYSFTVGLNEGRSIVRRLESRQSLEDENQRRIAENFGEGPDPGMDSGCYRLVGENREPIFRN